MKLPAAFCLVFLLGAGCLSPPLGVQEGDAAPDFSVTNTEFETVRLSDFADRPVVLYFFSLSCGTCYSKTRDVLVPLERDVGDEVAFLSLSVGFEETRSDLLRFKNQTGASWVFAWDDGQVAPTYGVVQPSTVIVLDRDHQVLVKKAEPERSDIEPLLA